MRGQIPDRLIHLDALGVLGAGDLERGRGELPVDSHGGIAGHKVVAAGNDNGMELLRTIVTRVVQPPVTADKVRPRLVPGEKRSLLAVFNDATEDRTGVIDLPASYSRATDLHRQAPLPIEQNTVCVTVPYQDVVVLLLE